MAVIGSAAWARPSSREPKSWIPELEKALKENIVAFWLPRCLDRTNGGYIINFGPAGEARGEGTRGIVTQARMVWLFARLARGGFSGAEWGRKELLDAAELGYRLLLEKMWDHRNGGFYWEVDAAGDRKIRPAKHMYGQSFALYALSEYHLASGRPDVLRFARRFFDVLEDRAHDRRHGGYIEAFNEDWSAPPEGSETYMRPAGMKLMNTHLHLMEAMTTFCRASRLPAARERLGELITIESNTVVRKDVGACTDKYTREWTPLVDGDYGRVSYGHDLENIWLLMDACDAAGIPNSPLADLYRTLFAYSRKWGYDEQEGGFFESGHFGRPADRRDKIWWVQAEALVSALRMYEMTKEPAYLEVFERTWDFVSKRQIDWEHGEWHAVITPEGKITGDKANIWKAGYHNGRALIECLATLAKLP